MRAMCACTCIARAHFWDFYSKWREPKEGVGVTGSKRLQEQLKDMHVTKLQNCMRFAAAVDKKRSRSWIRWRVEGGFLFTIVTKISIGFT